MVKHRSIVLSAILIVVGSLAVPAGAVLLLDDPLQGSTTGVRDGGQFVSGGWQVTGDYDSIFWHLPYPVSKGAAEFYVTGIAPDYAHKTEHFHMYDYTFSNADYQYTPGYRDDPFKHFIRKSGLADGAKNGSCEILWQISPEYFESDTSVLSWSTSANYKFRLEWGPEGGSSRLKVYRDSSLILDQSLPGNWTPVGHSVRIGCSTRRAGEGSEIGAKYSYLKVWDLSGPPTAPAVSLPVSGRTVNTTSPLIQWSGEAHTHYQVRLNTSNAPDSGITWNSGQVASTASSTYSGAIPDLTNYYVFVRMANSQGWGDWSAVGYWFRMDTSYVNPGGGRVEVYGNCLQDDGGPFLGLGFTYMRSLQRCKYDRSRWISDLASMAGKGFNYQRILSMVGWTNLEIAPIAFTNSVGTYIPAWPDYWQQFRDCIDVAYDTYGIRTEITIFADAQNCMPNSSDRYAHMDNVLANLVGREHKVILIEVANEYWQNGFPDPGGVQTVRTFGQYLADRTTIPVAFSSTNSTNQTLLDMYGNSAADIATEHFSRDIGTSEGGWLPVRDCWRVADLYPSIPPVSSNEPIGAGSSVATENDPIKLCSAAVFAWIANLPMYVYHSRAGVAGDVTFEGSAGFSAYQYLRDILPPDLPNWTRNDGKETSAPFTVYCMGQANKYWTDVGGATDGCHRNIGGIKNSEFVCYPQGILAGGVTLEARRQVTFKVYNPLTGQIVMDTTTKDAGQQFTLAQGPGAYIIKGTFGPNTEPPRSTVSDSPFTSGNDGWNIVVWRNHQDYGYGTMAWDGISGNPGGCMRCTGTGDTDNSYRYLREGGEIWKTIPTTGYQNIRVSYDLIAGPLGGDYTGSGDWLNFPVDHDLIDEQLTVFYSANGGSSWSEVDWIKRDGLLSGYQSYGRRQIDMPSIGGAGDNPNFALRFRWQFNSKVELGDYGCLDNIVITGTPVLYTLTGNLVPGDYIASLPQAPVTVELRKQGGGTSTRTIEMDAGGNFSIPDVEAGTYDLHFITPHWLRKALRGIQVPGP